MRSTRFSFQLVLAALAAGGIAVGCSSTLADSSSSTEPTTAFQDNGSSGSNPPPRPVEDAAGMKAAPYYGNPLCHVEASTCTPDDDVACPPAPPSTDAGAAPDLASRGCRVRPVDNVPESVAPKCASANSAGGAGASCELGEDCAPGFDCVAGEKGKTCRHYCCSGTCKGSQSNGSATFCDVQSLADLKQKAPVCMPLKRCNRLLGTMECSANETCAVVTEAGDTGCVAIGEKRVGESCDEAHCAANLTCFGQPGTRKCFKLCKVDASDCPSAQSCVTNAAFRDAAFGVCQ